MKMKPFVTSLFFVLALAAAGRPAKASALT